MARTKNTKARLLEMDELRARPCEVDGRPALFHRWVEEDRVLLNIDVHVSTRSQTVMVRRFRDEGVIPCGCSVEVLRETFALIEFQDGLVAKVDPVLVRFVGKEGGV